MAQLTFKMSEIEKVDIVNTSGITASKVYEKYKPDAMINLALYNADNNKNIVYMEDENIKSGYLFDNKGFGIKSDGSIVWCKKDDAFNDNNIKDYVSGAPTLVVNGKVDISWGNKVSEYLKGSHTRSVLAINDNELILISTTDKRTLEQIANDSIKYCNAKYAINLDGGGSCHLQSRGSAIVKSTRSNASWLLVYLKKNEINSSFSKKHICIDAGHGMPNDSGAVGIKSLEAENTKYIATRVSKLLKLKGFKVTLIDSYNTLANRCNIANNAKCDYFISIHNNAAENSEANGVETFVYSLKDNKTVSFAKCIHDKIVNGRKDRGIKEAKYTVLTNTKMPACLLELEFISNPSCEDYLLNNLEKISELIVSGIEEGCK